MTCLLLHDLSMVQISYGLFFCMKGFLSGCVVLNRDCYTKKSYAKYSLKIVRMLKLRKHCRIRFVAAIEIIIGVHVQL